MKVGDLFIAKYVSNGQDTKTIVEVLRTWYQPDIDPLCSESVEIVDMLEIVSLNGPNIGQRRKHRRRVFLKNYERVVAEVDSECK